MRVLYRSRQNDRLHVMLVLVHIDITPPHTPLPVFRRIGERTIPYSWRASRKTGYCGAENISRGYHKNGGRVLFSDESKCTRQSDSRRVIIWRENGAHFHFSCVTKIDNVVAKESLSIVAYVGWPYTTVRFRCGYCRLRAIGMRSWKTK
ncbi:uncharacterized protein TNCV_3063351 [Trichonephila clavipes]|nr:uncharacterized protein TNCV_3063351 [Trichonephila clavipes]